MRDVWSEDDGIATDNSVGITKGKHFAEGAGSVVEVGCDCAFGSGEGDVGECYVYQ